MRDHPDLATKLILLGTGARWAVSSAAWGLPRGVLQAPGTVHGKAGNDLEVASGELRRNSANEFAATGTMVPIFS